MHRRSAGKRAVVGTETASGCKILTGVDGGIVNHGVDCLDEEHCSHKLLQSL